MHVRLWSFGLILCGLGLFAVAAYQYFGPEDGPGLIVDEPEREISGCSVGQTKAIRFSFHNRARHPVRIIGLAPC
jgi:hypothetical protein